MQLEAKLGPVVFLRGGKNSAPIGLYDGLQPSPLAGGEIAVPHVARRNSDKVKDVVAAWQHAPIHATTFPRKKCSRSRVNVPS